MLKPVCNLHFVIQGYYLIFNLLLTIEYLIKVDPLVFNLGHQKCIEEFTKKLENKEIEFDIPLINKVYDKSVFDLKYSPGVQLSAKTNIE